MMPKQEVNLYLTGTKYPNADGSSRENNISNCIEGEALVLRHTPIRQDKNAVRVFRLNGEELGWIPRENAREIAGLLDRGAKVEAVFHSTYRRYINAPLTANILIIKPEMPESKSIKTCGYCGHQVDITVKNAQCVTRLSVSTAAIL